MSVIDTADDALTRAIYFLDRELAPTNKVRAFQKAKNIVADLDDDELAARVQSGTLTDLDGIGKSTASVIVEAINGVDDGYLAKLDERSRLPIGEGAEVRAAIKGDCHLHSDWSDGGATIRTMARIAIDLGHEYIVQTDHSARLTIAHGLNEERLGQQREEIAKLNADLAPFRVLSGMEVDIFADGSLDLSEEYLQHLDVVVASVHSKLKMPSTDMTKRLVTAVAHPSVNILGHCTNRKLSGGGRPPSQFDAEIVFAACAKFDTAVEINCRPERQDPPDELLELAMVWDCKVAINTDAHAPGQLEWQQFGCDKAARLGVPIDNIINTWSADRLLEWAN